MARYSKTAPPPKICRLVATRRPEAPGQTRLHAANRRLSPDQITQLAADYRTGHSTTWLMQTYDLGKGTVLRLLEDQDVQMRGQGIPDDRLDEAIRLYVADGLSLMKIASRMDCSAETVRRALLTSGVQMRARWERGTK